jgi:G3E family GTPase
MSGRAPVHLNFLFGFLGAGKTTLVQHILARGHGSEKLAVIVNEFGEVGIDGAILSEGNIDLIELTSGCLCCTLRGSLMNAVEELSTKLGATRIIIEATGVAQPHDLINAFDYPAMRSRYRLAPAVTVVDASKFARLMAGLGKFYRAQIESAGSIILNKIDAASTAELNQAKSEIAQLNPGGRIYLSQRCQVDLEAILDTPRDAHVHTTDGAPPHAHDPEEEHAHHAEHYHDQLGLAAESFVLDAPGDSTLDAVSAFFRSLPATVWRAKGYMQIEGRLHLLQYSMGDLQIRATDSRPVRSVVFIGQNMERGELSARFRAITKNPLGQASA